MSNFDPQKHHRRSIRLPGYDYTQAGAYYVTIVTHNRENLFGEVIDNEMCLSRLGHIAHREWERLVKRFKQVELGAFVVMPNHVHGILIIHEGRGTADSIAQHNLQDLRRSPTPERFGKPVSGSIPTIVRSYKSAVTLRINYVRPGDSAPVWQRNYASHVLCGVMSTLSVTNTICRPNGTTSKGIPIYGMMMTKIPTTGRGTANPYSENSIGCDICNPFS